MSRGRRAPIFGSRLLRTAKLIIDAVDAGNRGLGAVEADPNHHRQPRELRGPLIENIVHDTFLGENGGQYKEAGSRIPSDSRSTKRFAGRDSGMSISSRSCVIGRQAALGCGSKERA